MTATDYRQIHAAIMRCCAELRGIAARLKQRREVQAASLIAHVADELHELVSALQTDRDREID